jgi:hypothetical protein
MTWWWWKGAQGPQARCVVWSVQQESLLFEMKWQIRRLGHLYLR